MQCSGCGHENRATAKFCAAARAWYDSPEYQKIVDLRTDNSEGVLILADEFVMPR